MTKKTLIESCLALIIFTFGAYCIVSYGSWMLLLGIFLLLWANNIEKQLTKRR